MLCPDFLLLPFYFCLFLFGVALLPSWVIILLRRELAFEMNERLGIG